MTNTLPQIVFFGTDAFSLTALTALIEAEYPVAAVVTKPDSKQGRGHKIAPPLVKVLASSHNIPVWQPDKLSEITSNITALGQPIGVLSSYGKIIPQSTIDLFHPGIINIHPSLLPRYRGPTPIETAIANGDEKTGVSIMQLAAGMDDGPVYIAKEHALTGKETNLELYHALATIGADLLLEALPRIIDGSLIPHPQNDSKATYTKLLTKEDSWLQPESSTAAEAERRVRAHLGFPKTKSIIDGHTVIITKAHVSHEQQSPTDTLCRDGAYLSIDELIAPSGRRMSAADFERGYLSS
jgi:methionyl-tRNA formyltransferase